jgi:hypothetical protein
MLGIAPSTAGKEPATDPIRLEALRARQREDRAARWKSIESLGLDEVIGWLEAIRGIRTATKRMSKRRGAADTHAENAPSRAARGPDGDEAGAVVDRRRDRAHR